MITSSIYDVIQKPISGEWGTEPTDSDFVNVLRTTNFTNNGKLNLDNIVTRCIPKEVINKKSLIYGDIIIEKSGGSPSQPVGRVVFFDQENGVFLCNNFTAILRPKNVFNKYMFYVMYNLYQKKHVLKYQNKTTGIINLQLNRYLKSTKIRIPELKSQQKIVAILDQAQVLIDKRKQQITKLDQLAQSTFLEMFGDPITNPMGWESTQLHKACKKILGGGTPSKQNTDFYKAGTIPWVTPKDMKSIKVDNSIDMITEAAVKNSSVKMIPKYSVIMVIRSGILKKKLPVAITYQDITVNQDMKAFIVNREKILPWYLTYFFLSAQRHLLSKVRAVTADNIEFSQIKEMPIPLPPTNKQTQFASIIEAIEAQKAQLKQSLVQLETQFNALMQRAFNGELIPE